MSEIQTVQQTKEHPAQQEQQRPLPFPAQEGQQPAHGETHLAPEAVLTEQWLKMSTAALLNDIEDGTITNPSVLPVLAKKGLMEQQLLTHSFIQQQPERKAIHEAELAELETQYQPRIEGEKKALIQHCLQRAERYMTFDYPYTTDNTNYDAAAKWYAMAARLAEEKAKEPVVAKPEQQTTAAKPEQKPLEYPSNQAETTTAAPQERDHQEADDEEEEKETAKKKEKDPQDLNWEGIATVMEHPFSGLRMVLRGSFPEVTDEQFDAITDTLEYEFFELTEHFAELGSVMKELFHDRKSNKPHPSDVNLHNRIERGKKVVAGIIKRLHLQPGTPLEQESVEIQESEEKKKKKTTQTEAGEQVSTVQ